MGVQLGTIPWWKCPERSIFQKIVFAEFLLEYNFSGEGQMKNKPEWSESADYTV
jgi:hypothetical protein